MSHKTCLDYLHERTTLRPEYPDAWNKYGLALSQLGRHQDALAAFDNAVALNSQYHEADVSRCFALADSGSVPVAFAEFRKVCFRGPDDFQTIFPLGVFCMRFGWKETGIAQLLRAESMRPHVPYVLATTAAALLEVGDEEGAERRVGRARSALRSFPVEPLSEIAESFPDLDTCRAWENPNLANARHHKSEFLTCLGNVDEAEEELLQANRRYPGHALLMVHMGKTLLARQRHVEASQWLAASMQVDRNCHQAHFELSFLHAENGNLERALKSLSTAVRLRPMYPDYRYHLGTLLMDAEKTNEAIDEFQRVLLLNPSFGHGALQLASAYLDKNASEKTLAVLENSTCANWPEALILSAQAYLQRGQTLKAQHVLEKALEVDQGNCDAIEALRSLQVEQCG